MFTECSNMQLGFKIPKVHFMKQQEIFMISPLIDLLHKQAEAEPSLMIQNISGHHAAHNTLENK